MALHGRGCARAPRLLSEGPEPVYPFLVFAVVGLHWVNVGGPMRNAVESLELAERLASSSDRRRMLKLAEAWVELANGTHDRGCRRPLPVAWCDLLPGLVRNLGGDELPCPRPATLDF